MKRCAGLGAHKYRRKQAAGCAEQHRPTNTRHGAGAGTRPGAGARSSSPPAPYPVPRSLVLERALFQRTSLAPCLFSFPRPPGPPAPLLSSGNQARRYKRRAASAAAHTPRSPRAFVLAAPPPTEQRALKRSKAQVRACHRSTNLQSRGARGEGCRRPALFTEYRCRAACQSAHADASRVWACSILLSPCRRASWRRVLVLRTACGFAPAHGVTVVSRQFIGDCG